MGFYPENILKNLESYFLSIHGRMHPLFLLSAFFIAYFFTRKLYKVGPKDFFSRFFGKEIFGTSSFRVDLVLFLLIIFGISDVSLFVKNGFAESVVGDWLNEFPFLENLLKHPGIISESSGWYPFLLGCYALFFVFWSELIIYSHHWFVHLGKLWHIHKIHHSASRLGIFTFKRDHPIDWLLGSIFGAIAASVILPLNLFLFGHMIDPKTLTIFIAVRAVYFSYGMLNHSEVWLCFPNWLSYLFVSPAMHQIHHSQNEKHYNKNFSTMIPFWDWVFGTLYIPGQDEYRDLKFGIAGDDKPDEGSIRDCLIYPFRRIFLGCRTPSSAPPQKSINPSASS